MNEYGDDFEDDYTEGDFDEREDRKETPEALAMRLRAEVDAGDLHMRPELAEALMQWAQEEAGKKNFESALAHIDEALDVAEQLIDDGQFEFQASVGRCMLFRAAVIRVYKGNQAGLTAFNETIRYFADRVDPDDPNGQHELAIALMNKADLLIDPFGAYSAAVAAQEQAVQIWRSLVESGMNEYRQQLASTYLATSESRLQAGDVDRAILDAKEAVERAREVVEEGDVDFRTTLVQALLRIAKLYEQTGHVPDAFEALRDAIAVVRQWLDEEGDIHLEPMLTALYLQHGLLYERIGDPVSAIREFERSRDVYLSILRRGSLGSPGDYMVRTGLANVLMCRGNMLADLKRYEEAEESFKESEQYYRHATEFRPEDDPDDTFIPYTIGIVQLNLANMFVIQGRLEEAVALKEKAIESIRERLKAGHEEIFPNLMAAYRKMVGIRRMMGDTEKMFACLNELISVVDEAVDSGKLEYRSDLAVAYHLRGVALIENERYLEAEKDFLLALRLFRAVADDESDAPEVHLAKLQWGESLDQIAKLFARQNRVDEAINLFQKAIDDVLQLYDEGNWRSMIDVLLGYSQFAGFIETLLREDADKYSLEDRQRWSRVALETVDAGIELCQRSRATLDGDEFAADQFYLMKIAFFQELRGALLVLSELYEKASHEFAASTENWMTLVENLDEYRKEQNEREDGEDDFETISTNDNQNDERKDDSDPLRERYLYYIGELRQTLQRWAHTALALKNTEEADRLFMKEIGVTRKLLEQDVPGADRFLILSLTNRLKAMEEHRPFEENVTNFEEAANLIRKRFEESAVIADDWFMFRHVYVSYALFLGKNQHFDRARKIMDAYVDCLNTFFIEFAANPEGNKSFPDAEAWIEVCRALDMSDIWFKTPAELKVVRELQRSILARHPDFDTDAMLAQYDKSLRELV